MKYYKNSIYDVNIIFNQVYLSNTWIALLQTKYEKVFREDMSGAHITTEAVLDITLITCNIFISNLAELQGDNLLSKSIKMFDSFNIIEKGIAQLEE